MKFVMMRKMLCGWLLAAALGLSACNRQLYLGSYTLTEPVKENLVGVWQLDEASLRDLRERGKYDLTNKQPRLTLAANGTIEINDLPDWVMNDAGQSHGAFQSYAGIWQIGKGGGYWQVTMILSDMSLSWYLRNEIPPYQLHMTVGNPDEGRAMVFVRQP
jgi:hypothetical protein